MWEKSENSGRPKPVFVWPPDEKKTARCLIQLICIGLCTKNGATRKWIGWQNTITSMIVVRSSEWVVSIHAMHDTTNVLGTHLFDKANDTTNVNYSNICLCYEKPCYESNEQWTDCQQLNQCQLINWSNNVNQPCLFYYIRQNCQLRSNIIRCCMIAAEDRLANASIQCIYPTPIRARSCVANAL